MLLEWLQIAQVRILEQIRLEPGARLNLFVGPNAGGKTAFLEAIHLLARARSFRTPRIQEVVRNGLETLQVSARACYQGAQPAVTTGIEKGRGLVTIRYGGAPVRTVSEQARRLPVVLATPDSHELVTASPKQRRHWLDWAMFHVEPDYLGHWRDYVRALRHRNSLLKDGARDPGLYLGWERTLARSGTAIQQARQRFVDELGQALATLSTPVFNDAITLRLDPGWPTEVDLEQRLAQGREADRAAGFTRPGPHRADIHYLCNGQAPAARFSRGQIKLLVCLIMVAQGLVMEHLTGEAPVYLLDDYAAELDQNAGAYLLQTLLDRGWQAYITATEFREQAQFPQHCRVFHVEHGRILKVVE